MNKSVLRFAVIIAFTLAVLSGQSLAAQIEVDLSWEGDDEFYMLGTMIYDDSASSITTADYSALESMTVSFYNPSDVHLGTFEQVTAGAKQYDWFTINYDIETMSFVDDSDFDFGSDGHSPDDKYLYGAIGQDATLYTGTNTQYDEALDTSNPTEITVVPEPATMGLLGFGALGLIRRKK
ncbi:PEP-CTERM sorting domain-containing protein [Sedimentisphaera cyanobacteriorum]|uniref:PEP-CTERM sorting domain-containing protein n=1 Tax=Sedimentisphaera cyanobacteriorum TaxID=1940790 RepID=A0A1Q2HNJ3_9BACT|nr:PEP-CTERM sorting domain-containing protein [Sedimentisphaera cyanobacteriorum]AQQ09038.1 PEP-CTERM sorting domain-containing protein [Sedimentisphaera cyanobacteriorum]